MNTKNSFATALKQVREACGMTMRAFSEEVGITLSSLVEYEAGRRLPRGDTVNRMADKLRTSPVSLIAPLSSDDLSLHLPLYPVHAPQYQSIR